MDSLPHDPEELAGYTILERIGEGPRGVVYRGRQGEDGDFVAIKLLPEAPDAADIAGRLKSAKRVSSSYVARVLDTGVWEGRPYVVREFIEGRSLAELVEADGPLSGDPLERVAVAVLTALTPVHLAGMAHCGLTPHNVIMGEDGPRVTDVAIGDPAGEIGYRSPEQLNSESYGPYTDVFSWAAVVTFAATGKPPFGHEAQAVLNAEPELGAMAEPLRGIVLSALSKMVGQRPTTYSALLGLLGDKPAAAPGAGPAVLPGVGPAVPGAGSVVPGVGPAVPGAGSVVPGVRPAVSGYGPGMPVPPQAPPPGQASLPPNYDEPLQGLPVPPPAPLVPQQADGSTKWGPPPPPTTEPQQQYWSPREPVQTAGDSPARKFPVGLVAALAAVVLVSALGLWGASQYAPSQTLQPAAASGDQSPAPGSASNEQGSADTPVAPPQQQQQLQSSGQPEVTVPWAKTPEPQATGVLPFEMPRDDPSDIAVPELSTVPSPLPTQPVATQGIAQPTVTVTSTPASTERGRGRKSPDPQVTETVQPTPSASGTPQPQATVTVTATPTPTPTPEAPKPTTQAPRPTEKPTTSTMPTTTAQPSTPPSATVRPTTQPTATSRPSTSAPKPTTTQTVTTNPYTPVQVCGNGFVVQRSTAFAGGVTYQLFNGGTGQNCVVTLKNTDLGKASPVSATLEVQNGQRQTDSGNYEFYAGPVKLQAKGKCVRYSGTAGSFGTSSPWGNCG